MQKEGVERTIWKRSVFIHLTLEVFLPCCPVSYPLPTHKIWKIWARKMTWLSHLTVRSVCWVSWLVIVTLYRWTIHTFLSVCKSIIRLRIIMCVYNLVLGVSFHFAYLWALIPWIVISIIWRCHQVYVYSKCITTFLYYSFFKYYSFLPVIKTF